MQLTERLCRALSLLVEPITHALAHLVKPLIQSALQIHLLALGLCGKILQHTRKLSQSVFHFTGPELRRLAA